MKPSDSETWCQKAEQLTIQGKYNEALNALDIVLRMKADHVRALNTQGISWVGLGNYENAYQAFEKAIGINPNKKELWYNKAIVLKNLDRVTEAEEAIKKAKELTIQSISIKANNVFLLSDLKADQKWYLSYRNSEDVFQVPVSLHSRFFDFYGLSQPQIKQTSSLTRLLQSAILSMEPKRITLLYETEGETKIVINIRDYSLEDHPLLTL